MVVRVAEIPVELSGDADCASCASRLQAELEHHRGLVAVEPSGPASLRVSYDPDLCSLSCLNGAAESIGARLERSFHHEVLPVEGMDCYDCAQTIEQAVGRLSGVTACSVNFPAAQLRIEYDAASFGLPERLRKQVAALGYRIPELGETQDTGPSSFAERHRDQLPVVAALVLLFAGIAWSVMDGHSTVSDGFYAVAVVIGGWRIARAGFAALLATRRPDINLLMTIAVIGAAAIDAWLEAALVVVLFSIGEALESFAVDRARRSIAGLVALAPSLAVVIRDDEEREIAAADLVVGDVVVVRPGEQIPADGSVAEGASSVNQATITGESVPADKESGDAVYAGTLNGEGRLLVRVDRAPGDTTLARITRAVTEAQAQKTATERWVDRFARVYTPTVLLIAILTAVVPPLVGAGSFEDWFYRGLAFLILACPCALVIATPVAVVAALARASAAGVLIKGGAYLEVAAEVRVVAFDKTGTLTNGAPRLVSVACFDGQDQDAVLRLAASLEAASEHPLAGAVVDAAHERGLSLLSVDSFQATRGSGVIGRVGEWVVRVAKPAFFAEHKDFGTLSGAIATESDSGHTVALVAADDSIVGLVAWSDGPRADASSALAELRRAGIERTVLLTGDHQEAAEAVARVVGVDEVRAGLLPDEKVAAIEELQRAYGPIMMVGDGVNDAPALARSSLGVAMGTAGSPTAIETADVALMGDDLLKLSGLITLARATRGIVRQNITFSLGVKAVAALFAFAGLLPLWLAVLADVGATLLVVANGLRLLQTESFRFAGGVSRR